MSLGSIPGAALQLHPVVKQPGWGSRRVLSARRAPRCRGSGTQRQQEALRNGDTRTVPEGFHTSVGRTSVGGDSGAGKSGDSRSESERPVNTPEGCERWSQGTGSDPEEVFIENIEMPSHRPCRPVTPRTVPSSSVGVVLRRFPPASCSRSDSSQRPRFGDSAHGALCTPESL